MKFTWVMDHFLYIPIIGLIGLTAAAIGQIETRLPANRAHPRHGLRHRARRAARFRVPRLRRGLQRRGHALGLHRRAQPRQLDGRRTTSPRRSSLTNQRRLFRTSRPRCNCALTARNSTSISAARSSPPTASPTASPSTTARLPSRPPTPTSTTRKAIALLQASRIPEALAQFQQALTLRPNYALALDNQGIALAQSRRFPEAIAAFTAALKLTPDRTSTLDNLASAQLQAGQTAEARATFQRVLQLDPQDPKARQALAPGQ